jgi:hypothetical protein
MPALAVHHTATSDGSWDGPANEARLPSKEAPLRASHAWIDSGADPNTKAAYKFIHHEVDADGKVGAANLTGCSTGIGVLNGGRGGTTIPDADREGVHAHLAAHLKDAGKDAPALAISVASATNSQQGADMAQEAVVQAEATHDPTPGSDALVAEAQAAGYNAAAEIMELCAIAGKPALASEFTSKKFTRAQASAELLKLRAAESGPEIQSHILPDAGTNAEAKPSQSPVVKIAEAMAAASKGGK